MPGRRNMRQEHGNLAFESASPACADGRGAVFLGQFLRFAILIITAGALLILGIPPAYAQSLSISDASFVRNTYSDGSIDVRLRVYAVPWFGDYFANTPEYVDIGDATIPGTVVEQYTDCNCASLGGNALQGYGSYSGSYVEYHQPDEYNWFPWFYAEAYWNLHAARPLKRLGLQGLYL
jgi:hypothetical protein